MDGILTHVIKASVLALSLPAILLGFTESNNDPMLDLQHVLRPDLSAPVEITLLGQNLKVQRDLRSGTPRVMSGFFDVFVESTKLADFADACKQTISEMTDQIGSFKEGEIVLDKSQLVFDQKDQFLKFRIFRNGTPIKDASIDCRFKRGKLVQIVNMSFKEARADLRGSRANYRRSLLERFRIVQETGDRLRVVEDKRGYRLIRTAEAVVSNGQEVFIAQVDKASGEIFEMLPTKTHLSGDVRAKIYSRSYKDAMTDVALASIKISDKDSDSVTDSDRNGLFQSTEMARVFLDGYVGEHVYTHPITGSKVSIDGVESSPGVWTLRSEPDANAKISDDRQLAHAMVYYHTDKIVQMAKQYVSHDWLNIPLLANINLSSTCNAHWNGLEQTINFYVGDHECANTALLADVIYHEWGHGLDYAAGGIEDGAYSEGFGDIMSLTFSRDHILAKDFFLTGEEIRDLKPKKIYPKDRSSSVHAEGQIIGSTFWNLFTRLKEKHGLDQASEILRNYAFKMIMTTSRYTDVYHALIAIDDDDDDLSTPSPNYCIINKAFTEHGLAIIDADCMLATIDTYRLIDDDRDGILSPGESAELIPHLQNRQNRVLSGVSLTAELESNSPLITLINKRIEIEEDIAPLALFSLTEGFTFSIDPTVPCGTKFNLNITLDEVSTQETDNITLVLAIGRDRGVVLDWVDSELPMEIPDPGEIKREFTMGSSQWSDNAKGESIVVKMKFIHSYMGDIRVFLKGPEGLDQLIYSGNGPQQDAEVTKEVAESFKGLKIKGDWRLKVRDAFNQDSGSLESFSITMKSKDWECR
jgi:hypothetical protein